MRIKLNERDITLTRNIFFIAIYLYFYIDLQVHPPFKPKATFLFCSSFSIHK